MEPGMYSSDSLVNDGAAADRDARRGRELAYEAVTAHLCGDPDRVSELVGNIFENWGSIPHALVALIEGASSTAEMWAESQKIKPTAAWIRFTEVMLDIRYASNSALAQGSSS